MAANIDRQRVGVRPLTPGEHVAHRVEAHGHARGLAPILEKVASLAIFIRHSLAIVAARDAGADLGHLHQTVPKAVCVDLHVCGWRGHGGSPRLQNLDQMVSFIVSEGLSAVKQKSWRKRKGPAHGRGLLSAVGDQISRRDRLFRGVRAVPALPD